MLSEEEIAEPQLKKKNGGKKTLIEKNQEMEMFP